MPHVRRQHLTLFSGPIIERNGEEKIYVGAYLPETVRSADRMRVQECIGFLAVPNFDSTTYPQPRDGWIARPARESEETIEEVIATVCDRVNADVQYEQQTHPIPRQVLEQLIGVDAIIPPSKSA